MARTTSDVFTRTWQHRLVPLLALLMILALPVSAGNSATHADREHSHHSKPNSSFAVGIANFGKIDDHYYRGAQPGPGDYKDLVTLGVRTIVDLRNHPEGDEKSLATAAGLRYISLPMSDKHYPPPDAAQRFLAVVNNPLNWPVYVHCAGGRHRTGVMTAVYRMTVDKWDIDHAYQEMKQYDFYSGWGHEAMKKYIYDYYRQLSQQRAQQAPAAQPKAVTQ